MFKHLLSNINKMANFMWIKLDYPLLPPWLNRVLLNSLPWQDHPSCALDNTLRGRWQWMKNIVLWRAWWKPSTHLPLASAAMIIWFVVDQSILVFLLPPPLPGPIFLRRALRGPYSCYPCRPPLLPAPVRHPLALHLLHRRVFLVLPCCCCNIFIFSIHGSIAGSSIMTPLPLLPLPPSSLYLHLCLRRPQQQALCPAVLSLSWEMCAALITAASVIAASYPFIRVLYLFIFHLARNGIEIENRFFLCIRFYFLQFLLRFLFLH